MGNKIPYSSDLAAKVVALYRQRVCVRLIVQRLGCSVAQAKRAIRESPTRDQDAIARLRAAIAPGRDPKGSNASQVEF